MEPRCTVVDLWSVFQAEARLFDDGIGEDLAGDAGDLGFRLGTADAVIEREHKVLSLPYIGDSAVLHLPQRIRNCLPLGIQHGPFQRDIDMSLHLV